MEQEPDVAPEVESYLLRGNPEINATRLSEH